MNINHQNGSLLAYKLKEKYRIFGVDILQEQYSCTIEFPGLTDALKADLRNEGFSITHEKGDIYTLQYKHH